jgi:hypothetical protein
MYYPISSESGYEYVFSQYSIEEGQEWQSLPTRSSLNKIEGLAW